MRHTTHRPHYSYSALAQYLRCPLQFYFERVARLPRRTTTEAQALGSSLHAALATYHRTIQVGEVPEPEVIRDVLLSEWRSIEETAGELTSSGRTGQDALEVGLSLLDLYLEAPPPGGIVAVEQPLLVPLVTSNDEVLEEPLLVVPDLITRMDSGRPKITEFKTSGRAYSESEAATSLQPTAYGHAVHELTGLVPSVEYAVFVKTRTPRLQTLDATRSPQDFRRLGDIAKAVSLSVSAGSFYPVESPLNCSGCPYYRPCRTWPSPPATEEGDPRQTLEALPCSSS